jgi:glycogen synthase
MAAARLPRRVLMTGDSIGGVWTYALELTRALAAWNVQVYLAVMGRPLDREQSRRARSLRNLIVFESGYRLEWMNDPWEDVERAGKWLLSLEQRFRPDVVHLNGYVHAGLPFNAPTVVVAHSCVLSWWSAVRREMPPRYLDRYGSSVRRGVRAARAVAAPSRAMLAEVRKLYGPIRRGTVIPNGLDGADLSVLPKEPFILTAGRLWDDAKNVRAVVDVASRLSWPVYLAGEEREPRAAGGGLVGPGATERLGVLSRSDLATWYARSSIYVLPARYEPFGLSALEAALSGCALVLGRIPSLIEIWGDGARYVDPDNPDELAVVLQELIDNAEERRELARRARERAVRYTAERMAGEYLELYSQLIEEARPGPGAARDLHEPPIGRATSAGTGAAGSA